MSKENLLQKIWSRSEKSWNEIKQKRAAKSLRVQAEQDLLEIQDAIIKKDEDIEKDIEKSKESRDWKSIRSKSLECTLLKKELEAASNLYEEFFDKSAAEILED